MGEESACDKPGEKAFYIHIDINRRCADVDIPNPEDGLGYMGTDTGTLNPADAELSSIEERYPAGATPVWEDGNPPTEIVLRSPSIRFGPDRRVGHSRMSEGKPRLVRVSLVTKAGVTLDIYVKKRLAEGVYRRLRNHAEAYGFAASRTVRTPGGFFSMSDRIEADYESEDVEGIISLYKAFDSEMMCLEGFPDISFTRRLLNI